MTPEVDRGELAELFLEAARSGAGGERIAGRLSALIGAPVEGVLLYGSLARGTHNERSDIDALIVADSAQIGVFGKSGAIDLDLHLVSPDTIREADAKDWVHVDGGKVLYDLTGEIARLLERVAARKVVGPEPWSPAARQRSEVWSRRMCGRIAANLAADPALAALQSGWLRTELYEHYFRVRGLWPRSAKEALAYWRERDPVFAELVEREARAADGPGRLESLAAMVEAIFAC